MPNEPWFPSTRLRSAASAERERIARELVLLDRSLEQLDRQAAQLRARKADLAERMRALHLITQDDEPSTSDRLVMRTKGAIQAAVPADAGVVLRGAQIREFAVRVLVGLPQGAGAVHYRDWYRLLADRGIRVSGRDPEASFLTQISRSPVVERTSVPGTYRINHRYPLEARARLTELKSDLAETFGISSDADEAALTAVAMRRADLGTSIARLERNLREALRSLGESGADEREVA